MNNGWEQQCSQFRCEMLTTVCMLCLVDLVHSLWHSGSFILLFHESFCRKFRVSQFMDTVRLSIRGRVCVACCGSFDSLSVYIQWVFWRHYDQTTCECTTWRKCREAHGAQFSNLDFSSFSIFHDELHHSIVAGNTDGHLVPSSYQICSLTLEDGRYSVLI